MAEPPLLVGRMGAKPLEPIRSDAKVRRPRALWEHPETGWQIALALPVSIGFHAAIVVIMVLQSLFAWKAPLPPPRYEVMLVGPIKKGTPGGGAKAAPPGANAAKPQIAPAAKTNELVIPVSTPRNATPGSTPIPDPKTAKAEALARIQKEAALKRMQELQAKSAIPAATPGGNGAEPIPQATAAAGGSGDGTGDGGSEYGVDWSTLAGAASYEQQINAIITANWLPPANVSEKESFICRIRVVIGMDGKIATTRVELKSDSASFDASTLAAVKKSDPLPAPPIDLKAVMSRQGMLLEFDNRKRSLAGVH